MNAIVSGVCGLYGILALVLGATYLRDKQNGKAALWMFTGALCLGLFLIRYAISQ